MIFKVGGPTGPKAADRKKATGKTERSGPTFASLLDQASGTTETAAAAPLTSAYTPLPDSTEGEPHSGRDKAATLLGTLQELAEDALAGQPTAALNKLQTYLATEALDRDALTEPQKQALDEVATRAAVEAEKLKP